MKLIASLAGTVVLHVSSDDVMPKHGILQRDLIQYIAERYQFSGRPAIPPNAPPGTIIPIIFNQGKFVTKAGTYPVLQIIQPPNGDIVTAGDTDVAELVLEDLVSGLEADLKFNYRGKKQRKSYVSVLTVECDAALENQISAFRHIEEILNRAIPRENMPFKPKSLIFGYGDPTDGINSEDASSIERTDFALQRRAGSAYEQNRYFSQMPLPTNRHFEVLQEIEAALRG